jgi:nucleotide-binding universal stress UspA family protein
MADELRNGQPIVVAVDGSEGSSKAMHKAASIARTSGSRLIVVHVINTKDYPVLMSDTDDREAEARATCIIDDMLEIANSEGVSAESAILHGHPVSQIIRFAEEKDAGMIVTGSRGLHGAKAMLVGSISEALTKKARCSVLVVR